MRQEKFMILILQSFLTKYSVLFRLINTYYSINDNGAMRYH